MKLILEYYTVGNDRYIIPVVYTSKEDLLNDFMYFAMEALENKETSFTFLNIEYDTMDFFFKSNEEWMQDPPQILTIDEFFEDAITYAEEAYQGEMDV